VATVDEMSGGRVELGVGAGWNDAEHSQYGLAFPDIHKRADLMEDELAILHGLWEEPDGWSFDGTSSTSSRAVVPSQARPEAPSADHRGRRRQPSSLRLAARYADEYNMSSTGPDECAEKPSPGSTWSAARSAAIRHDSPKSVMAGLLMGADAAEFERRIGTRSRWSETRATDAKGWLEERRPRWIVGTPDQARAMAARFAAAGVDGSCSRTCCPATTHGRAGRRELIGKV
jgi:alkanesulfonate monooxygenase SsuD/methylene tetrahydromethanopterin reductase-like flavin-dependent oxidoreductase (luciferase family)